MRKVMVTLMVTGLLMFSAFNVPALAATDPTGGDNTAITDNTTTNTNTSDNDNVNTGANQNTTKYFNLQFGDTEKKGLLMVVYQAQDGDTLDSIAQKYNMSVDVLKFLNQLPNDATVTAGQQFIVAIPQQQTVNVTLSPINQTTQTTPDKPKTADNSQTLDVPQLPVSRITDNSMPYDPNPRKIDPSIKNFTQQDLDLLARVAYSEARGEGFQGQVAVASVVLNRTRSSLFPHTVAGVIYQPWAFTAVYDGQFNLTPDAKAYEAAKEAMKGFDPSNGALYYWNPTTATSQWVWSRRIITRIGNHVFAL